jgi:cell division protease FtsH
MRLWGRRFGILAGIYIIYSLLFRLVASCSDELGNAAACSQSDAHHAIPQVLLVIGSFGMQVLFLFFFIAVQFMGLFWFLARGHSYTIFPHEYDTSFEDVRGQEAVVNSVQEVVKLFRGYRQFKKIGGYPPHGILFEGPPGTGKTLMAKAVAGTVGVPFLYNSGTGFSSMFMGIGNIKIMRLFRKAKKYATRYEGAVIFIDELDAIGSRGGMPAAASVPEGGTRSWMRFFMGGGGMGMGSGIVNELLVQMDGLVMPRGFARHWRRILRLPKKIPSYNILIIGATNRAQALDVALLRPGRFDRKIHVGLPDKDGRKDVIDYYLQKVPHDEIDLERFAQATIGFSPARIKNIINEALIVAHQDGRTSLSWGDIWQAKLVDEIGLKQPVKYTPREKEMTAIHEAGHAVAARELQGEDKQIQVISIVKRESTLGVVHSVDLEERFGRTKEELLEEIKVFLAGQAAEEIWFDTSTTGPSSDLQWSTLLALNYIGRFGMGKRLLSYSVLPPGMWGQEQMFQQMLEDKEIKDEVDTILKRCKADVTTVLKRRSFAVERIRDELLEREELVGDELESLMREISDQIAASRPGRYP